jgi:hypothetical protein
MSSALLAKVVVNALLFRDGPCPSSRADFASMSCYSHKIDL